MLGALRSVYECVYGDMLNMFCFPAVTLSI